MAHIEIFVLSSCLLYFILLVLVSRFHFSSFGLLYVYMLGSPKESRSQPDFRYEERFRLPSGNI
jgi:hypothetical protein